MEKDKDKVKNQSSREGAITRKEAIGKMAKYGKYAALTAIGTYIILSPKAAQAQSTSSLPPPPPDGFNFR